MAAGIASKEVVGRALRLTKAKNRPPLPTSANNLLLNPHFSTTRTGERFLLHDEVYNNDRILIYASDFLLTKLFSSDLVLCDGTFKMVPHIFEQLFTLNIFVDCKLFPVVYALLKRKNAETYSRVLRAVHAAATARNVNFRPRHLLSDFENGILQAFHDLLPNSSRHGCLFHFCQCLLRKIQQLGLIANYRHNPLIKQIVRTFMSLPFLPTNQIELVFNRLNILIAGQAAVSALLQDFVLYFRREWIINVSPEIWSVNGREVRTTNDLEGWHFAMTRDMPRQHPDIFTFIDWMISEDAISQNTIAQIEAGTNVKRKNKLYADVNVRLMRLQNQYAAGDITRVNFLRGVSYNLLKLPIENQDADGDGVDVIGEAENHFQWDQLNNIAGIDAPEAVLWQPWA